MIDFIFLKTFSNCADGQVKVSSFTTPLSEKRNLIELVIGLYFKNTIEVERNT